MTLSFWSLAALALLTFASGVSRAEPAKIAALGDWSAGEQRLKQKCEALTAVYGTKLACTMDKTSWQKVLTPAWFEETGESMSYAGVAADRCDLPIQNLAGTGSYSCFKSDLPSKVACKNEIRERVKSIVCKGTTGKSSLALAGGVLTINAGKDSAQDVWDIQEVKRLIPACEKSCP